MKTCLITGGAGNIACQLSFTLAERFDRIVLFDVAEQPIGSIGTKARFERADVADESQLAEMFQRHQPQVVIHLAALLSASCEADRARAWRVNAHGSYLLLETALRFACPMVVFTSTVASYGGMLPQVLADDTPQWPEGLYGVTKVAGERLGNYFHRRHGLDFRCVRLPITISRFAPLGAASALASHAFISAVREKRFSFPSYPQTPLALIYVEDVLRAIDGLVRADSQALTRRVYNLQGMTATAEEIAESIRRRLPDVDLRFEPEPAVAKLLASWPGAIDDSAAQRDWGWRAAYDLEATADDFIRRLKNDPVR